MTHAARTTTGDAPGPSLRAYRPAEFTDLVRVGRDFDGGYVLPRSVLAASDVLLSLGVNDDWSFEEGALALNSRLTIVCVDGTTSLRRIVWRAVRKAVDMIGHLATLQTEKLKRNAAYMARPFQFLSFFGRHTLIRKMVTPVPGAGEVSVAALLNQYAPQSSGKRVLLKVDIEGGEYSVLDAASMEFANVAGVLVEFHSVGERWKQFASIVRKLEEHFVIAHVHGNNFEGYVEGSGVPRALELTFVNRAHMTGTPQPSAREYPLAGLDMPNNWKKPDLKLRFDE